MPEIYEIKCSDCAMEFKAPFKPSPGRPIYCPYCIFKHHDLSNILYFSKLKDFLRDEDGEDVTVSKSREGYIVVGGMKEGEPILICTIVFEPKYDDILPRHPIKSPDDIRVPPFSDMKAKIKVRDETMLALLNKFVKKYKFDGITSSFV